MLEIPHSTYYDWLNGGFHFKRGESLLKLTEYEKKEVIEFKTNNPKLGHYKVTNHIRVKNIWLSYSSTYNVLREKGLLLKMDYLETPWNVPRYEPIRKNLLWEEDWTMFRIDNKLWNLIAVIDVYSRYIVAWDIVFRVSGEDVRNVLERAYKNQNLYNENDKPKIRFDQSKCNISKDTKKFLKGLGYTLSPGRIYRPTDQGRIERFFRTLKQEEMYIHHYKDEDQAKKLAGKFISYYNNNRPHTSLWGFTPWDIHFRFQTKTDVILFYRDKLKEGMLRRIEANRQNKSI